jgi:hypothetical protein
MNKRYYKVIIYQQIILAKYSETSILSKTRFSCAVNELLLPTTLFIIPLHFLSSLGVIDLLISYHNFKLIKVNKIDLLIHGICIY